MIHLLRLSCRIAVPAFIWLMFLLPGCSDVDVYTVTTEVAEDGSVIQKPHLTTTRQLKELTEADGPQVSVANPIHDFGRMDPLTTGSHTFVIRNVGNAPLELKQGPRLVNAP